MFKEGVRLVPGILGLGLLRSGHLSLAPQACHDWANTAASQSGNISITLSLEVSLSCPKSCSPALDVPLVLPVSVGLRVARSILPR